MNVKGLAMKPIAYNSPASLNAICLGVEDAKNLTLNLERQGMLKLPVSAPVSVSCLEGAVWITLDNDTRDFVLEPCEAFTATEHRRAVIYALKPSRISVTRVATERRETATRLPHRPATGRLANPALAASAIWG